MRYLATATMAASVLAIGLTNPAVSLPLGGKASAPDTAVHKVQQREKGMEAGGSRGRAAAGKSKYGYGPGKLHRGGGFYFSGPNYGDVPRCGSLRRRAVDTGSRYWWRRYQACRGGLGG